MGKDTGGLAFPLVGSLMEIQEAGMTLRDCLAAKAMGSYLTHAGCVDTEAETVAGWAYEMADAMLKARNA